MNISNVTFALLLTVFAGISTGIGSLMAFFMKKTSTKFLSFILGFSGGVMIYISMIELFPQAYQTLSKLYNARTAMWITVISFFAGMIIIAVIDKLIPSHENPHEARKIEDMSDNPQHKQNPSDHAQRLMKMGLLTSIAIAIHNFPEGIATFIASFKDPSIGIAIAVAVAIHNIPEGIAVSVPIFAATGDRKKALVYSFFSGLSEPLGAFLTYLFLLPFISDQLFGIMFAAVAGIMVFISLDELLPTAREYEEAHLSTYGLMAGMALMAVSLILFM